jgi:hypothetical protein
LIERLAQRDIALLLLGRSPCRCPLNLNLRQYSRMPGTTQASIARRYHQANLPAASKSPISAMVGLILDSLIT